MSRRSSRLVSSGYYNSDEDSDSSTVTNVSYRENPVKVFKKKGGNRKSSPRTPSRTNSNAASSGSELPQTTSQSDGLSPSLSSSQTPTTMRTVSYVPIMANPRPALNQTDTHSPSVPRERSPQTGLYSFNQPVLHFRPNRKELGQSGVDSSGYSSSEGSRRKPIAASNSRCGAPSAGHRNRMKQALSTLMDSVSSTSASLQSKLVHLAALANASVSSNMKKAGGLVLLLLLLLFCVWFLLPLLTSFISRMTGTVTKTPAQTTPRGQPVIPASPSPQLNTMHPTPTVDSSIVSAAVEAKMLPFVEALQQKQAELQQRQERLLLQVKEGLYQDIRDMKASFHLQTLDRMLHMEKELAGLSRHLVDSKTDSQSAAASLSLRIQSLEAQNVKLSQEWSTMQLMPPPAPCPDPSTTTVQDSLTPELQQAMEKWLTDRIKEQDALRFADRGGCSDCPRRPVADRMADFALETQGASVVSTRCSETYRIRSACVTLFGFPLWYPSESPRTVIQGFPVLLPGKCWAFHGVQGTLVISLSHPITISHVTLDHLPRFNSPTGRIDSAPKDFEVYGMKNDTEEGTLLGKFTYDEDGESTQTFELPNPSDSVYRCVELRVLSNWGHVEYTCLYRFRVHGHMAST